LRGRSILGNVAENLLVFVPILFWVFEERLQSGERGLQLSQQVNNSADKRRLMQRNHLQQSFGESLDTLDIEVGLESPKQ
jgi:hypothetical protein